MSESMTKTVACKPKFRSTSTVLVLLASSACSTSNPQSSESDAVAPLSGSTASEGEAPRPSRNRERTTADSTAASPSIDGGISKPERYNEAGRTDAALDGAVENQAPIRGFLDAGSLGADAGVAQDAGPIQDAARPRLERPELGSVTLELFVDEGCGSSAENVADFGDAFQVIFAEGLATFEDELVQDFNCQVMLNVSFPQGWVFDFPSLYVRGFARTAAMGSVSVASATRLGTETVDAEYTLGPAAEDDYVLGVDGQNAAAAGGVECGATAAAVQIDVTARASGAAPSLVSVDALDGALIWHRCELSAE